MSFGVFLGSEERKGGKKAKAVVEKLLFFFPIFTGTFILKYNHTLQNYKEEEEDVRRSLLSTAQSELLSEELVEAEAMGNVSMVSSVSHKYITTYRM